MTRSNSFPFTDARFIGFDSLFNTLSRMAREDIPQYPPTNIEKVGENAYRITMALAGFDISEIEVSTEDGNLSIKGEPKADENEEEKVFIHKGIARRSFVRSFKMVPHVEVVSAGLKNGVLTVDLKREIPESEKAKVIEISAE